MAELSPGLRDRRERVLQRERHAHGALGRLIDRQRIAEKDHHAVAGEVLERAAVFVDRAAKGGVIGAQQLHHFVGIGAVGERGEAAQIEEHRGDLAPVRLEQPLAAGDDGFGHRPGEKALEARQALELRHLVAHALGELGIDVLQLVLQRLHPQERAHAREQLLPVDGLRQEIVGAGFQSLDALALRVERRHQDQRQERGLGRGAQPPAKIVAVDPRHQDVGHH